MRKNLVLLAALALAGCQSTAPAPQPTVIASAFDPASAAYIKRTGEATIAGHAFWRDDNGGVHDASGEIIRLVPATPYARERFARLYKGGRSVRVSEIEQIPADPAYGDYTRTTRAESSGRFTFDHVAPGDYFVTAQVRYRPADETMRIQAGGYRSVKRLNEEGGAMFDQVTVSARDAGPIKLVLTNDR
ncbi:MAG: carboxypeptidase regulatory-like domain-containing protein [Hyphomicrobiales bacterium]|nr:carboxypeptidase regulatory-like domain-containing protein [Hyphomicrobiales bacterium]